MKVDVSDLLPYADELLGGLEPLDPVDQMKTVELIMAKLALKAEFNFATNPKFKLGTAEFVLASMTKHAGQIITYYKKHRRITVHDTETEKI